MIRIIPPLIIFIFYFSSFSNRLFAQCSLPGTPYVPPTASYCPSDGGASLIVQNALNGFQHKVYRRVSASSYDYVTSQTPSSGFLTFGPYTAGTYQVRVVNSCGQEQTVGTCTISVSSSSNPSGSAVPSRSLSQQFCDSNPGTLSFTAGEGSGYVWYIDDNPYAYSRTFAYPFNHELYGVPGSHVVRVNYNVSGGACNPSVPVSVGSMPVTIISPSTVGIEIHTEGHVLSVEDLFCKNTVATFWATPEEYQGGDFTWNTGDNGNTGAAITKLITTPGYVSVDFTGGCATGSAILHYSVSNPEPPVIPSLQYCDFESVVLKPAGEDLFTYRWYTDDGEFIGDDRMQAYQVLKEGAYNFEYEVVNEYECISENRQNVGVTVTSACDDNLNWIETIAYDENDSIYSHSKAYFDDAGKSIQTQTKQFTHQGEGRIFATQPLYDRYDRAVGATLGAPISGTTFHYDHYLLEGPEGARYMPENFDDPQAGKVLLPDPVGSSASGTVGWYYSENNTLEEFVPTTSYPYSRTEFYEDGTGEVKRSAGPGDMHRLGMGHEVLTGTFPVFSELDHYLDMRRIDAALPDNLGMSRLMNKGVQSVVRDENGEFAISISDKSGKGVLTARKGNSDDEHVLQVTNTVHSNLTPSDANYRPITYFYILHEQPVSISVSGGGSYIIEDIVAGAPYVPIPGFSWAPGFYRVLLTGEESASISFTYTNYFVDVSCQFYDDAGRLRYSVSPNGFVQLESGVDFSLIDKTSYEYNHRGWLLSMTEPDAGKTEYAYRKDGSIRFSQNAQQRQDRTFSYTNYDKLGRPTESGQYTLAANETFANLKTSARLEALEDAWMNWGGTKQDWVKTHYDASASETPELSGGNYEQTYVRGAVSWTENANITTWYSYDELGRVTWMAQKPNALNRTFLLEYTYDFLGNVKRVVSKAFVGGSELTRERFVHRYEYDADKRLSKTFTSTDGANEQLRATYIYYLHGPLKRVELGNKLQGIDFIYNINGWLTQINHPDAGRDPGRDGDVNGRADYGKDVFGMILNYYESDFENLLGASNMKPDRDADPMRFHQVPVLDQFATPNAVAYHPAPVKKYSIRDLLTIYRQQVNTQGMKSSYLISQNEHDVATNAGERLTRDEQR